MERQSASHGCSDGGVELYVEEEESLMRISRELLRHPPRCVHDVPDRTIADDDGDAPMTLLTDDASVLGRLRHQMRVLSSSSSSSLLPPLSSMVLPPSRKVIQPLEGSLTWRNYLHPPPPLCSSSSSPTTTACASVDAGHSDASRGSNVGRFFSSAVTDPVLAMQQQLQLLDTLFQRQCESIGLPTLRAHGSTTIAKDLPHSVHDIMSTIPRPGTEQPPLTSTSIPVRSSLLDPAAPSPRNNMAATTTASSCSPTSASFSVPSLRTVEGLPFHTPVGDALLLSYFAKAMGHHHHHHHHHHSVPNGCPAERGSASPSIACASARTASPVAFALGSDCPPNALPLSKEEQIQYVLSAVLQALLPPTEVTAGGPSSAPCPSGDEANETTARLTEEARWVQAGSALVELLTTPLCQQVPSSFPAEDGGNKNVHLDAAAAEHYGPIWATMIRQLQHVAVSERRAVVELCRDQAGTSRISHAKDDRLVHNAVRPDLPPPPAEGEQEDGGDAMKMGQTYQKKNLRRMTRRELHRHRRQAARRATAQQQAGANGGEGDAEIKPFLAAAGRVVNDAELHDDHKSGDDEVEVARPRAAADNDVGNEAVHLKKSEEDKPNKREPQSTTTTEQPAQTKKREQQQVCPQYRKLHNPPSLAALSDAHKAAIRARDGLAEHQRAFTEAIRSAMMHVEAVLEHSLEVQRAEQVLWQSLQDTEVECNAVGEVVRRMKILSKLLRKTVRSNKENRQARTAKRLRDE